MARTPRAPAPASTDVSFPAFVAATAGAATWAGDRIFAALTGDEMPPEIYVWVQLAVPLVMARAAAGWRARRKRRPLPPA